MPSDSIQDTEKVKIIYYNFRCMSLTIFKILSESGGLLFPFFLLARVQEMYWLQTLLYVDLILVLA